MLVYIKRVRTGDNESQIATRLSSAPLRDDPRNHCVPILHIFRDADDESIFYMVMPFLRLINRPPFETIENVVDFIDQVLEGLVFLHQQGVAHRDCTFMNIMMDANSLYPQGFHPVRTFCLPDGNMMAWPLPRTDKPIKYYFIDFGISVDFPPDATSRLVLGEKGRDQDVPELSNVVPYDPFKVDIFIVGNLLLHQFYTVYGAVSFYFAIRLTYSFI
ncbi:hypothetical protein SCP_0203920 [Sparassis crispa]|uniref:Protein kinase domain-containing protein n=1 Tax=Sparassis crispa TaxID=139825 RepID=A0A401GAK9_9APHY|nr:hypothetical protein SCP_0203920 [Sparassis crispa]GBE79195.1 hypothetical protein SCP_0203920 [Sparassis crispa]